MKQQGRNNVIGRRLHCLRREKGITQLEICLKIQAGGVPLSQSALSKIEAGERRVRDGEVLLLAHALGVSVGELLCGAFAEKADCPGIGEPMGVEEPVNGADIKKKSGGAC